MAFSEVYVDPSIDADSGSGTLADPYGDLEYAIESETEGADGTIFHIKSGTAEVLAAELGDAMDDTSVGAFTPSNTQPIVFRGYNSVGYDGGVCEIQGGANSVINDTGKSGVCFVDCILSSSASYTIRAGGHLHVMRCSVTHTGTNHAVTGSTYSSITGCYIRASALGAGEGAISIGTVAEIRNNYIDITDSDSTAYAVAASGSTVNNNIVVCDGAFGIRITNSSRVWNNSIYANASTRIGIYDASTIYSSTVVNNIVSGFSGVGGIGIRMNQNARYLFGGNAVYDCTTGYSDDNDEVVLDFGDNEVLAADPFTDAANGDFSPVDTGNIAEGALPNVIGGGFV